MINNYIFTTTTTTTTSCSNRSISKNTSEYRVDLKKRVPYHFFTFQVHFKQPTTFNDYECVAFIKYHLTQLFGILDGAIPFDLVAYNNQQFIGIVRLFDKQKTRFWAALTLASSTEKKQRVRVEVLSSSAFLFPTHSCQFSSSSSSS